MSQTIHKAKRKSAPVSSHPLFPGIVALWFGALFGLGSLAIRPTLIEGFVLATRIDSLVPAASPPLGVTARILLALALAVFGGLLGAALAKRIARPKAEFHERKRGAATLAETALGEVKRRGRDSHPDAPARRPISAHDEIGGEQIAGDSPASLLPGRRRALALDQGETRFDVHDLAPLPGGAPQILELGEMDLGEFAEVPMDAAPIAPARQMFGQPADSAPAPFTPPPTTSTATPQPGFSVTAAEQIASAPLDSLGLVELTARFAGALERRREREANAAAIAAEEAARAAIVAEVADVPMPQEFARFGAADRKLAAEHLPQSPLAMPTAMRPLNFDEFADDDESEDDYSSFLPLRRMTLPVAETESEPEPEREVIEQIDDADATEPHADTDIDEDDGYSSLLELSRPSEPRPQFVRIDEPAPESDAIEPVVIFPGQVARAASQPASFAAPVVSAEPVQPEVTSLRRFDAPSSAAAGQPIASAPAAPTDQDSGETEQALRAALATLQRMSGAA